MKKTIEIREYQAMTSNPNCEHPNIYLQKETFDELKTLIGTFNNKDDTNAIDFLGLSITKGIGEVIKAKNYVGIIQLKNGTQIQILPKIDAITESETDDEKIKKQTKETFIKMLRCLRNFPYKTFDKANLATSKMNIYEIFIQMYLQEVDILVKKGLKSSYQPIDENAHFYKGKILFNQHIKLNLAHKERFYVRYDEFNTNRAENRLIKTTLLKLLKLSANNENIKMTWQLLSHFEMVNTSTNYTKDFSKVINDRSTKVYEDLMKWSKVFLLDKSFSTFTGETGAKALLFPMEKVFEDFVGKNLKRKLSGTDWKINLQDKGHYLFQEPIRKFRLIPDIVLEKKDKSKRIIMDTKWKALCDDKGKNYGISQSDMYQMYAYSKKYSQSGITSEIVLLYPINKNMQEISKNQTISFKSDDDVKVSLFFVNVKEIDKSLQELIDLYLT